MRSTYVVFERKGVVGLAEEEVSLGDLRPKEVVIRNETSIISAGTELARLWAMEPGSSFPMRPGYGSIGIIEARGPDVTDFSVGDRVFYAGKHASVQRFMHAQGHQWGHLFAVPDGIDPIDAALVCMAQIAMTAPNMAQIRLRDSVVVFGLGLVGQLCALLYKLKGARVIGVDPIGSRTEMAKRNGVVDDVVACDPADQATTLLDMLGEGADVTVDAAGHPAVIETCVKVTRPMGEIQLLGSPRAPYTGDLTSLFFDVHVHGKAIRGAHMWRHPVTPERGVDISVAWNFKTLFELMKAGILEARRFISHIIRPGEIPRTYEALRQRPHEYLGVVIDWR